MISIVCGHCYCYQCQFRAPLLKIQCRQCRERRGLVIETQIRLLVNCYKRMCHILASELNQNPQILDANGANPVNHVAVVGDEKDKEKVKGGSNANKDAGDAKTKSKTAVSASFNPIMEILKEIEDGTKVSRAVLIVKPPLKYVNAKLMPTPKKDASSTAKNAIATASDKVEKDKEKEGEGERESPMETEAGASSTPSSGGGGEEKVKRKRGRKPKRQLIMPPVTEEGVETQENSSKEKDQKTEKKQDSTPATKKFVTVDDLTKAKRAIEKLKPSQLEISVKSLDSKLVKVSADTITIKESVTAKGVEPVSQATPGMLSYVRFILDKDGNRKRIWDPLCPRIVVKRSRASIDKMRNLQTKSVGAKLRSKERKRKTHTPPKVGGSPSSKTSRQSSREFEAVFQLAGEGEGETGGEEPDHQRRLRELEQEHGLQLPDLDTDIDPDLELDATWLQELCEGIEEDFMVFAQPPIPGPPPPMPFPPTPVSSTPPHHAPIFGGPPYSQQHHLPPPPHFSPHHPHAPPAFMLPPPPHHHHHHGPPHHPFMSPTPRPPLPLPPRHHGPPHPLPPRGPPPTANRPPPIRIHHPTSPREGQQAFPPYRSSKHQLPVIVGKMNVGKSAVYPPKPLLSPSQSAKAKKRRSPGYSESGWRCRCGTNNVMFPEKVCAKGKCPCFSKGIPCKNCLCRHCHNPFNNEDEEPMDEETTDHMEELDQSEQSADQVI